MRYARLGKTDLQVSAIAFGTWSFGGDWGGFDADEAKSTIGRALDLGITFFDTAQAYGFGASERLLADALWSRVGRDEVIVATKGGLRKEGSSLQRDASARSLREGVDASLHNLRTDYIDLYQVHWPDPKTPAEETGRVLADLVREGKIRHAGVSNHSPQQMTELAQFGPVETDQPPYHMFHRDIEREVLPYAAKNDLGVLVYGPLAHGLLSGTMTAQTRFASDDWRSGSTDFNGEKFTRELEVVQRLKEYAAERAITLPQLAVAWTLSNPVIQVAIVGARHAAHLDDPASAVEILLSESDRREVGRSSRTPSRSSGRRGRRCHDQGRSSWHRSHGRGDGPTARGVRIRPHGVGPHDRKGARAECGTSRSHAGRSCPRRRYRHQQLDQCGCGAGGLSRAAWRVRQCRR